MIQEVGVEVVKIHTVQINTVQLSEGGSEEVWTEKAKVRVAKNNEVEKVLVTETVEVQKRNWIL